LIALTPFLQRVWRRAGSLAAKRTGSLCDMESRGMTGHFSDSFLGSSPSGENVSLPAPHLPRLGAARAPQRGRKLYLFAGP